MYAKNACCVKLSLVLRERVNHNCTEIFCEQFSLAWLFGFAKSFASLVCCLVNKPNTQLTSDASDFV